MGDLNKYTNGSKIVLRKYSEIKLIVSRLRKQKKKIVLTQGSWDMIHIGHARYLNIAKKHGDVLIVGVDSDHKIRKRKGPDRPIVPEKERIEMLTHLKSVDFVVLKQVRDPKWALIKAVRPDSLIVISENYSDSHLSDLKKLSKEVVVLPRQATTSTSAKLRLLQMGVTKKLGETIMPKIMGAIEEVFGSVEYKVKKRK